MVIKYRKKLAETTFIMKNEMIVCIKEKVNN